MGSSEASDFQVEHEIYREDAVLEYPQSGEPAGTPKQIVTLLNYEIASFVTLTDMKDRLVALGFEPVANTPEEFADRIRDDFEAWGKLIRAAHLKPG